MSAGAENRLKLLSPADLPPVTLQPMSDKAMSSAELPEFPDDPSQPRLVLVINGGSSSIKFAVYRTGQPIVEVLGGKIERIGLPDPLFKTSGADKKPAETVPISARDHGAAMEFIMRWLEQRLGPNAFAAIGHRIVHGGATCIAPQLISSQVLEELRRISPYDPEHMPAEIQLIELLQKRHPQLPQVGCLDTAFHHDMPRVARLLPLPRRFEKQGIQRYGFHGLSYAFLMEELARVAAEEAARGRIIMAHLGNGASLAAVRAGKPIDTSM